MTATGNPLWEAEHWFADGRRRFDDYLSSATSGEPAARGVFDVHLGPGAESLIFTKASCARDDTAARFFLHLIPVDEDDLPEERKQYGFDNLDFDFDEHGERFDGKCLATVPLPEYGIFEIKTGQYAPVFGGFFSSCLGSGVPPMTKIKLALGMREPCAFPRLLFIGGGFFCCPQAYRLSQQPPDCPFGTMQERCRKSWAEGCAP